MRSKILEKPIAIAGGGATAQTFAADLTLAGCKVRLYELPEIAPTSLGDVLKTGEIELGGAQINFRWFKRAGVAKVEVITTDPSEALRGSGLVIVSVPAVGHTTFFERIVPHLEDGQVVAVFTDNFGSLMLRRLMNEKGVEAKVIVGGFNSMPYGTRLLAPGKVNCVARTYRLFYDALPSKDGDAFAKAFEGFPAFDGLSAPERADTVIAVGFNNPNPVVHVPGSVCNVGAMEVSEAEGIFGVPRGQWSMYKHGMSPSISRLQWAFYQEMLKIANAIGIKIVRYDREQFFMKTSAMGVEYLAPFSDVILPAITGPLSVEHRYFVEDIGIGTVAYYNFAKKFGVDVPIIESLIRLGCVICQRDFFKEGRSLKDMGIEDLTKEQVLRYVRDGVRP